MLVNKSNNLYSERAGTGTPLNKDYNDFFHVVELAKKIDHQTYFQDKLNRLGFGTGSNSTGIINIIAAPVTIGTILYHWVKSKSKHFAFDQKEALSLIASNIANFVYSIGQLIEFCYAYSKKILGKAISTIAGYVYFPIEILYNSYMYYHTVKFSSSLNKKLLSTLLSCYAHEPKTKEELIKDVKSLKKLLEDHSKSLHKILKTISDNSMVQSCDAILNRINKVSKYRLKELTNDFNSVLMNTSKSLIKSEFSLIDNSYLKLTNKQTKSIDSYAKKTLKECSYPQALDKTLHKIQESHRDQKVKLSRILRPWVVEDYLKTKDSILTRLESQNISEKVEGVIQGLEQLTHINKVSEIKEAVYLTSIIINIILLTSLILCSFVAPPLIPTAIAALALLWSIVDYTINKGLLDSPEGSFQYKNLVPPWVYKAIKKLNLLGEFFYEKIKTFQSDFFRDKNIKNLTPSLSKA